MEPASVEAIPQDRMHGTDWHPSTGPAIDETCVACLLRYLFQRILSCGVPLEQFGDDRRNIRIGGDDLLAVRAGDVAIAERRDRRPNALLGLLLHPLARFLG